MATFPIPSHLQFSPEQGIQTYMQGIALGQRQASERNQAIVQSAQLAEAAAARAARERIAAQEAEVNAARFAATLAAQKQRNELAAREAALQYEGLVGFERDINAGVPAHEAILRNPRMFRKNPAAMGSNYKAFQPPFEPRVLDVDGVRMAQTGPNAYRPLPAEPAEGPIAAEPIVDPEGTVRGYGVRGAAGGVHPLRQDKAGELTPYQRSQILRSELSAAMKLREEITNTKSPEYQQATADITALRKELSGLRSGQPKAEGKKTLTKELALQFLQQAGGDKEKARQLARQAGYEY